MSGPAPTDALRAVLAGIPARVAVERLDRVWVFPPKEIGSRESGLVVIAALPEEEPVADGHRRLLTLQYDSDRGRPRAAPRVIVTEQGSAPPDRIPRVIAGVVARLSEQEEPAEHPVGGCAEEWHRLLEAYGIPVVDRANGE